MSEKMRRALEDAVKRVEINTPRVQRKLEEAGTWPDSVVVYSAAKYFDALDKLARE